ncbi:MAG: hypothetical protein JWP97_5891 [Labilithrix sp.]|nr:hypothetical protein [Labilithrix sp.]
MRRLLVVGVFLLDLLALSACGGDADEAVAVPDGGSRPADGARGICCPVSASVAHSYAGGYTEDPSTCSELFDNVCNPRVVVGEHGCGKLVYDPCERPVRDAGSEDAAAE